MPISYVTVGYKSQPSDKLFRGTNFTNGYAASKSADPLNELDDALIPLVPDTEPAPYYEWTINPPGEPANPNNYDYSDRWAQLAQAPFPIVLANGWLFPHSELGDPAVKYGIRTNYGVLPNPEEWSIRVVIRHPAEGYTGDDPFVCRLPLDFQLGDFTPSSPIVCEVDGGDSSQCPPGYYCCNGSCEPQSCGSGGGGGGGGSGGGGGGSGGSSACDVWNNISSDNFGGLAHRIHVGLADPLDRLFVFATISHEYYSTRYNGEVYIALRRSITLTVPNDSVTFPIPHDATETQLVFRYSQGRYRIEVAGRADQEITSGQISPAHTWFGVLSRHANINPDLIEGRADRDWTNGYRVPDYTITTLQTEYGSLHYPRFSLVFSANQPYVIRFAHDANLFDTGRPPIAQWNDGEMSGYSQFTLINNQWVSPTLIGQAIITIFVKRPIELLTLTQEVQDSAPPPPAPEPLDNIDTWLHGVLVDQYGGASPARIWIRTTPAPRFPSTERGHLVVAPDPVWGIHNRLRPSRSVRYMVLEAATGVIGRVGATGEFRVEKVEYGGTPYPEYGYPIVIGRPYRQLVWLGLTPAEPPAAGQFMIPIPDFVRNTIRFYVYDGQTNEWSEVAVGTPVPKRAYTQLAVIQVI